MELVGLEPTTRALWNVGVSDQLTLSDTKHSSSKRPAIDGHFHKSGNLRCARMRGGAGRTRTSNQTVMEGGSSPTSSPNGAPLRSIWVSVKTTFDRRTILALLSLAVKFGFPETENCGCGDEVRMRIRAGVRRFAKSGSSYQYIDCSRPLARMRINMRQVRGFGVAAPIRWADHRGA